MSLAYPLGNRRAAVSAGFFVWSLTNEQEVTAQDAQPIVTHYLEAFNETDADRRRVLLEALYTPDCTYTDPHVDLQGLDQIDGFIAQTQQRFPGFTFKLGGAIDAHHNQARFQWHAGPADAPDAYVGFDVIVTKDEGIETCMASWTPPPPPKATAAPPSGAKAVTRRRRSNPADASRQEGDDEHNPRKQGGVS